MTSHEDTTIIKEEVPLACLLDRTHQAFRVTRNKGKSLANGGFGMNLPDNDAKRIDYLFIEEVYFLVEQGLLEAYDGDNKLDVQGIFQLLDVCGMSLPALLVYAHVRSQSYRVIRHTPHRRDILEQMEPLLYFHKRKRTLENSLETNEIPTHISRSPEHSPSAAKQQLNQLRHLLREDASQAPAPVVGNGTIAYELYLPDSQFRRSAPGRPAIYVAATTSLHFGDLQTLLREADGIPLRTAVVSEAGTVVMLGVSDYGVPVLLKTKVSGSNEATAG